MSKFLFITVQIPFADFRRFTLSPPDVVPKPAWPKPSSSEFVRRFGSVHSRGFSPEADRAEKPKVISQSAERHYINANRLIKHERTFLMSANGRVYVKPCFLRVVGDSQAVVRMEIGLVLQAGHRYWHNAKNLDLALNALSKSGIFVVKAGDASEAMQRYNLSSFSAFLRRRYFTSSELHDGTGRPHKFIPSLLKSLDWSVVAVMPTPQKYHWLEKSSLLSEGQLKDRMSISLRSAPTSGNARFSSDFAVIGNFSRRYQPEVRRFRLHYLRLRAELMTLWSVVGEIHESGVLSDFSEGRTSDSVRTANLSRYLEATLNRVSDTLEGQISTLPHNTLISTLWHQDLVNEDLISTLRTRCAHLISGGMAQRTEKALSISTAGGDLSFNVYSNVNQGDQSVSKYNFEGPTSVGAVGDNARATKFANKLETGTATAADLSELLQQLNILISHIKENHNDDQEADVAIVNLTQAKKAAQAGDQSKAMAFLKASGGWALEKASAIGVPVAIAALKIAIGA